MTFSAAPTFRLTADEAVAAHDAADRGHFSTYLEADSGARFGVVASTDGVARSDVGHCLVHFAVTGRTVGRGSKVRVRFTSFDQVDGFDLVATGGSFGGHGWFPYVAPKQKA